MDLKTATLFVMTAGSAWALPCLGSDDLDESGAWAVRLRTPVRGAATATIRHLAHTPHVSVPRRCPIPTPLPIAYCAAAALLLFAAAGQGPPSDEEICSRYRVSREENLAEVLLSRYRTKLHRLAARLLFAESASSHHLEDVEAEMDLALVAAMIGYEARRGATFHTYLFLVAEHAGRDFLRREARHGAHALCSLDGFPSEDERGSYLAREARAVCCQAESDQDPVRCVLLAETYAGLLGALTEGERQILRVISAGGSEGDVARRLACSRDAARVGRSRMLRKAQALLKKVLPPL